MGEVPTTTNQTASTVNKFISVAGNTIVAVTEGLILAEVQFLNLPIIKQIWHAFFTWIASYFIRAAEQGATFAIIDAQVDTEVDALSKKLAALTAAQKSGDSDAIKKAIQDYADAHTALVHADGSAPIE